MSAQLFTVTNISHFFLRIINRTLYGAVLGIYSVLIVISLQAAIFWGQYANCDRGHVASDNGPAAVRRLEGVHCENAGAMKAMCTFSVLLFIGHVVFSFFLFYCKDRILGRFLFRVFSCSFLLTTRYCRHSAP